MSGEIINKISTLEPNYYGEGDPYGVDPIASRLLDSGNIEAYEAYMNRRLSNESEQ